MKHRQGGGPDRPEQSPEGRHGHETDHHHGRFGHGRQRRRLFDYGELRLLILAMIAEQPRHGYELIKDIEERFGGVYSPSPGVIYPTLAWLDDMGYAAVELEAGGRKLFRITAEGEAFLTANRAAADALVERVNAAGAEGRPHLSRPVLMAMKAFKQAMRQRLERGPLGDDEASKIAAALDAARHIVEQEQ